MSNLTLDTAAVTYQRRSVATIMLHVIIALVPGIALYALLVDYRILQNTVIACSAAILFECGFVWLRKRSILAAIKDTSVVLAAILLVLSVPQSLPTWQLITGVFILCSLGKHVFGGLGHNPFNPAMVAYAVLIVSFPLTMTQWSTEHGFLDLTHDASINNDKPPVNATANNNWDGVTSATPLDRLDAFQREYIAQITTAGETEPTAHGTNEDSANSYVDHAIENYQISLLVTQSDWIWISGAWLVGGLYLLLMRVISWHIPVAVLASLWMLYTLYGLGSSGPVLPATIALFSGAIMLGAFFIATDPVSAATSESGKLVYATGIGILCFVIREFSAYPEGIAFAVLLMNMCVPLIDYAFTRNRIKRHAPRPSDAHDSDS